MFRRPWAPVAVLAAALWAASARAGPLDLDLVRLGAPSADAWTRVAAEGGVALSAADAARLASESKRRFAILSTELALALSSSLLQPGSTTGATGVAASAETAWAPVHGGAIGDGTADFAAASPWPTRGAAPEGLLLPSLHVRKALPFSLELGGRLVAVARSGLYGGQVEGKWALEEGFWWLPDLAVRVAHTALFGQADLDLAVTDVDVIASKRFAAGGVVGLTPYLGARVGLLRARSDPLEFAAGDAASAGETRAAFPRLSRTLYRTTVGMRLDTAALSVSAEATYFAGVRAEGDAAPAADAYPDYRVRSSVAGALEVGLAF